MSTTLHVTADAAPRRREHLDLVRLALLLCWVPLLAYVVAFGAREASLGHLEQAVRTGEVTQVAIGPAGVPAGRGYGTQYVQWREGLWRHRAEVMMWNADRAGATSAGDGVAVREGRDLAPRLQALSADLTVTRANHDGTDAEVYDWWVPNWVSAIGFALVLLTWALLVTGRPTWRATKWAWFWLMATPLGLIAYLVLSGPTPGVPAPKSERPVLRGGWGFVLAAVMASFLPSWWH